MEPKIDKRTKEYKQMMEDQKKTAVAVAEKPVQEEVESASQKVNQTEPEQPKSLLGGKKPTKPWEKRDGQRPWRRDYFKLKENRPGFRCRFVNVENVERRIDMGYEIADPSFYGGLQDRVVDDGSPLGKRIVRRKMVLMEISEEGARYYEQQTQDKIKSMQRSAKDIVVAQAKKTLEQHGVAVQLVDKSKNVY